MHDAQHRLDRVRAAFAGQAERFDAYAPRADEATADRFRRGLGAAAAGRVLDVACGTGVVTGTVAASAAEVVGLDATEAMLAKARARCGDLANVSFQTGDAEALPFDDRSFDGVVTRLSLHHFAHPDRALAEITRVLRPGGRAVIVDVTAPEDAAGAALQNAIEILRDPSHVRMLPASELDRLIEATGLRVLATEEWEKTRDAGEWAAITANEARAAALVTVMGALAEAGVDAGLGLALHDSRVSLIHRWRLIAAERPPEHSRR